MARAWSADAHGHAPGGVVDGDVELVPPNLVVGEAFQVDDEDRWQLPQVKLLGRLLVLAAARTVPEAQRDARRGIVDCTLPIHILFIYFTS